MCPVLRPLVLLQTAKSTRLLWKRNEAPVTVTFDAGKAKAPNLKEGEARIVVETVADDFRGSTDTASTTSTWCSPAARGPRRLAALHQSGRHGTGVTFNASGSWNEAGVKVGKYTFRSFPVPDRPEQRFAMFAYPGTCRPTLRRWSMPAIWRGPKPPATSGSNSSPRNSASPRSIPIDDALIEKLVTSDRPRRHRWRPVPICLAASSRSTARCAAKNNQQLADLRLKTEEKVLWNGPFLHWGKEEADFADVRNYMLQRATRLTSRCILASTCPTCRTLPVHAANDGRVVYAADLGIYGNCVVVDHGYGLQSIYGHMRQIDVKVGDMVKKDQSLGVAGATGLAGGVHVHFSMQIDGVQVNPREWWDEHWIHDRILSKLDPARITPAMAAMPAPVAHARHKKR